MANEPSFTIGIEEEYLLVDQETRDLATDPPSKMLAKIEQRLTKAANGPIFIPMTCEI